MLNHRPIIFSSEGMVVSGHRAACGHAPGSHG